MPFSGHFHSIIYSWIREREITEIIPLEELPDNCRAIAGHLNLEILEKLDPDQYYLTTVLRDPLRRMVSMYQHWKRTRGQAQFRTKGKIPYHRGLTFEDFAFHGSVRNFQKGTLVNGNLNGYQLVGVTELLPYYLQHLMTRETIVPERVDLGTFLNRSPRTAPPQISTQFMRDFIKFHSGDYEIYDEAFKRAKEYFPRL